MLSLRLRASLLLRTRFRRAWHDASNADRAALWNALKQSKTLAEADSALAQLRPLQHEVEYGIAMKTYGQLEQWKSTLALLEELRCPSSTIKPNAIIYSVALVACSRARQAMAALELLPAMRADNVAPNLIHYTALMGACIKYVPPRPDLEHISGLWKQMQADGLKLEIR